MSLPIVEFIIPTYNRPHSLMMTIHSIYSQSADNWRISVVADAPYDGFEKVKNYFDGDDRITFDCLQGPHNDWGHTPRIHGLQKSNHPWNIMTGDDNYYFPCFLEAFNMCIVKPDVNFVFCDMYHNYSNYEYGSSELRQVELPPGYSEKYRYEGMDIGAFATRTELAKQIPFHKHLHWADGKFAADYWNEFCRSNGNIIKITKAFYVHN